MDGMKEEKVKVVLQVKMKVKGVHQCISMDGVKKEYVEKYISKKI